MLIVCEIFEYSYVWKNTSIVIDYFDKLNYSLSCKIFMNKIEQHTRINDSNRIILFETISATTIFEHLNLKLK